jgi:hypothetical protein
LQVYIPICIEKKDWLLVSVDMQTLHMYLYFVNTCDSSSCGQTTCIHHLVYPIIVQFESIFKSFLDTISYWEHSGRSYKPKIIISGSEVWPQNKSNVGCDSGILVCMLMRNIVLNLPMSIEGDLEDACTKYRRFMADEFYHARWLPNNV